MLADDIWLFWFVWWWDDDENRTEGGWRGCSATSTDDKLKDDTGEGAIMISF